MDPLPGKMPKTVTVYPIYLNITITKFMVLYCFKSAINKGFEIVFIKISLVVVFRKSFILYKLQKTGHPAI